jgi:hypothetical protein
MVAMFSRKPVFDRLFVQKAGHIFDLPTRAMAHDLLIPSDDLCRLENNGFGHSLTMRSNLPVFQPGRLPQSN